MDMAVDTDTVEDTTHNPLYTITIIILLQSTTVQELVTIADMVDTDTDMAVDMEAHMEITTVAAMVDLMAALGKSECSRMYKIKNK